MIEVKNKEEKSSNQLNGQSHPRDPILNTLHTQEVATVNADFLKRVGKLTEEGWEEMEVRYVSEHEKAVSDMLLELGTDSFLVHYNGETVLKDTTKKINNYDALGEEHYNNSRSYYNHILFETFMEEIGQEGGQNLQHFQQNKSQLKKSKSNSTNNDEQTKQNEQSNKSEQSEQMKPKTATQLKKEKQAAKDAKKAKKASNEIKMEDKIRSTITSNKIKEYFEMIRDTENNGEGDNLNLEKNKLKYNEPPNLLINNKVLELKGLTWLLFGAILARNTQSYLTEKNLPVALSMITGMIRFVDVCEKDGKLITGINVVDRTKRCEISHTLLEQIKQWVQYLIPNYETNSPGIYPYDGVTICSVARHLLATSDFPNAIPSHGVVPRTFQVEVMKECSMHYNQGFFYGLNPTIGVGKTSLVLAYAKFLLTMREKIGGCHFAIYSCDTDAVRKQVGIYCSNGRIPFAVANLNIDNESGKVIVNVVPNKNCKNKHEDDAIIVICDTHTTKVYLDHIKTFEPERFVKCTLLFDEPTNGADIKGSVMLDNVCDIFTLLPSKTMLISATLPNFKDIPSIIDYVMDKNYGCDIKSITSDEVQIGCSVYTMDKMYVTPFSGCKTKESILHAIKVVSSNPFLNRLCTIEVVMMLWEKMKEAGVENLEDLSKTFANPKNMAPSAVNKTCIRYLQKLSEQSDEIIEMVCSTQINTKENTIEKKEKKEDDPDVLFTFDSDDDDDDEKTNIIDYYELATKHSTKFKSQTLIAVGDPVKFCNNHFGKLFRDVISAPAYPDNEEKGKFGSIKNAVKRYSSALDIYNAKRESLEKNTKGSENKSKALQEYDNEKPTLNFPKFGVINSKDHVAKYGNGEKIKQGYERRPFTMEEVDASAMTTDDWIVTLLCCGIGIYAENNPLLCSKYKSTVNKLGSTGRLAFVIADDTICYGTNWPFTCVIVDETFLYVNALLKNKTTILVKRSINTIMQLMGRAGRFYKSWEAIAHVINEVASMIINYSQNNNYPQSEAQNMEAIFQEKLDEYYEKLGINHNEVTTKPKSQSENTTNKITVIAPEKNKSLLKSQLIQTEIKHFSSTALSTSLSKVKSTTTSTSTSATTSTTISSSRTEYVKVSSFIDEPDEKLVKKIKPLGTMSNISSSVSSSLTTTSLKHETITPSLPMQNQKEPNMSWRRKDDKNDNNNNNNSNDKTDNKKDKLEKWERQTYTKTENDQKFDQRPPRFSRNDEQSTFERKQAGNKQNTYEQKPVSKFGKIGESNKFDRFDRFDKSSKPYFGKRDQQKEQHTKLSRPDGKSDLSENWRRND